MLDFGNRGHSLYLGDNRLSQPISLVIEVIFLCSMVDGIWYGMPKVISSRVLNYTLTLRTFMALVSGRIAILCDEIGTLTYSY